MPPRSYDVVVIGAGPAGENAADYARQRGASVAIVEEQLVGGECSFWACMPSKALLRPTEVLAAARRVPAAAAAVTGEVDVAAALRSRDAFAEHWDDGDQVAWLEGAGVDVLRGRGQLAGDRLVEVTHEDGSTTQLRAERGVVLAVGTRPAPPPIEGIEDVEAWTNRDATAAQQVPERLVVLGGGPVGVELGQAMFRLGAGAVTIVEAGQRLLMNEEPYVSDELVAALRDEGITIHLGSPASSVEPAGDGSAVRVTLEDGTIAEADVLIDAIGRRVPVDGLGLDAVGIDTSKGGIIEVDDHLRVPGLDWLYVVGDANGRAGLTHQGKYQARLVGDALGGVDVDAAWADERALTRVVFTDPQVAAVGLTEAQAQEAGHDVQVVRYDIGATAGGALQGKGGGGPAQLVLDASRRVVLGATFVGADVADMLHAASIAIVGEVPIERLWHAVPAFPTRSEVWLRLLEELREPTRN